MLFQVVQHAENGVRDNRRLGTVRPSGLRKKFHSHCILGLAQPTASDPPTSSPQCFCTAQKMLAETLTTRSAGEVPKSTETGEAHASVPTFTKASWLPCVTAHSCGLLQQLRWEAAGALPAS